MKISLAQIDIASGAPVKNLEKMADFIAQAKSQGSDLIVFPEMSDTGYDMPTILETASTWEAGPVKQLQEHAKLNSINVVAGVSEREGDTVFNSIAVINRDGKILCKYRKTHLITAAPMHEERFLGYGQKLVAVNIEGFTFGLMTCYEIRFPEISRALAFSGAHCLLMPSAFPLVRLPHWENQIQARAIENQVYVAGVSRIGADYDGGTQFCGTSKVIDPYGAVMASGSQIHEALISAELDLEFLDVVRSQIKVHQDRRCDLYEQPVEIVK